MKLGSKYLTRAGLLALFTCSLASPALWSSQFELVTIGHWPDDPLGPVESVVAAGKHIYVATTRGPVFPTRVRLSVIDIADPAEPVKLTAIDLTGEPSLSTSLYKSFALAGNYIYFASGPYLSVISIANRPHPLPIAALQLGSASSQAIAVSGGYAFVVGLNELTVIDVSNPGNPVNLGTTFRLGGNDIAIAGAHAYIPGGAGLRIVDISEPAQPVSVAEIEVDGARFGGSVAVSGDLLGILDLNGRMLLFDISNPVHPRQVGAAQHPLAGGLQSLDTPSRPAQLNHQRTAFSLELAGNLAAISDGIKGTAFFDISDPTQPRELVRLESRGLSYAAAIQGRAALIADGPAGLQIVDIADPAAPEHLATVASIGRIEDLAISGNTAYLAAGTQGLQVVDLSYPPRPRLIAQYTGNRQVRSVALSGRHLFLADDGLVVLDVSNPAQPRKLAEVALTDASDVAVSGSYIYLAMNQSVRIFDISDPTHPQLRHDLVLNDVPRELAVVGTRLIVTRSGGAWQIDVSNPDEPTIEDFIEGMVFAPRAIAVGAMLGYVSGHWEDSTSGLRAFDLQTGEFSNLVRPPASIEDLSVSGEILYATGGSGVSAFSLASPTLPLHLGDSLAQFDGLSVVGDGNRAYVGTATSGLLVFDLVRPRPDLSIRKYPNSPALHLVLRGAPGQKVRLQRSEDLLHWHDWVSVQTTETFFRTIEDTSGPGRSYFYRAVSP